MPVCAEGREGLRTAKLRSSDQQGGQPGSGEHCGHPGWDRSRQEPLHGPWPESYRPLSSRERMRAAAAVRCLRCTLIARGVANDH